MESGGLAASAAFILKCMAPLRVLRSRLLGRANDASKADVSVLERLQLVAEPLAEDEAAYAQDMPGGVLSQGSRPLPLQPVRHPKSAPRRVDLEQIASLHPGCPMWPSPSTAPATRTTRLMPSAPGWPPVMPNAGTLRPLDRMLAVIGSRKRSPDQTRPVHATARAPAVTFDNESESTPNPA